MKLFFTLLFAASLARAGMENSTPGSASVNSQAISPDSVTTTGTGATALVDNGLVTQTLTNSLPAQTSGISIDTSKVFTLAQSTSGTNGNGVFANTSSSGGDYTWLFHGNCATGATGCVGIALGTHEDYSIGAIFATDVAAARPLVMYHRNSTMSEPMIEVEVETDWYGDAYPGLTPTYSGTFNGAFFRGRKRNVTQAIIDNDGSFYSYADSGNDYTRFYTLANTAGVLRANLPVARWDDVTGSYIDFSNALGGNLLTVVAETGFVTMTPSGAELAVPDGKYFRIGDNNAGAPTAGDCDNDAEIGRMSIDTTNERLYICNGATRAWDYISLTD